MFPNDGRYPFSIWELLGALVFCGFGIVLSAGGSRARALLRFVFPVYAVGCMIAFFVPSALGDNVLRVRYLAVPIARAPADAPRVAAAAARVRRVRARAVLERLAARRAASTASASDPSASATYWAPAIRYLHRHLTPSYRVEAVDTSGHWPAYYLPQAGIPLVRGWFRQDDFPQNAILYGHVRPEGLPRLAAQPRRALRRARERAARLQRRGGERPPPERTARAADRPRHADADRSTRCRLRGRS